MVTQEQLAAFMAAEFPQTKCVIVALGEDTATIRHAVGPGELRPGGTVSGPVLMAVADVALYVAILGRIGIVPLTVTTSLSINFLRKPTADRAILGVCRSSTEPRWDGEAFAPRLILPLSLSWDHRVIDGAAAARFNAYLGQILADFRRVLL